MPRRPAPLPPGLMDLPAEDAALVLVSRTERSGAVVAVGQLQAAGVSRQRSRASDLVSVGHGLRAQAGVPRDRLAHLHALVDVTPGRPVLSHATAAWLWGMWVPTRLAALEPVHLSILRTDGGRPRRPGVTAHWLPAAAPVRRRAGLAVTAPAWTWTDLATQLVPWGRPERVPVSVEARALEDLIVAGESLLQTPHGAAGRREPGAHPRCTLEELADVVGRRRNVRGVRLLRAALPLLREGSGSPAESRLRLRLVAEGFPEPAPSRRIVLPDGEWMVPDLVWEEERVCLEYEGDQHRTDQHQFREDIRRVRALEASGWRCVRVSGDVWTDPGFAALRRDLWQALDAAPPR